MLSAIIDQPAPHGSKALQARREFLARFFKRDSGGGYGDRFAVADRPKAVSQFAYPYATQLYLLWADVLADRGPREALVGTLQAVDGGKTFLASATGGQYGVPTSLRGTGKQWDLPYAWAPIQYFGVGGLIAADFPTEANAAMQQWIAAVNDFFARTGVLIEKYDAEAPTFDPRVKIGYAQTQRGFGWTNAVYVLFVNRLYQPL